jgi:hypothetical protein
MATRVQFENSAECGVFSKLTNAYAHSCLLVAPGVLSLSAASMGLLSYCLTAVGGSNNFYSHFEAELVRAALFLPLPIWVHPADHRLPSSTGGFQQQDVIPIVQTTIGGTRIIGRLCAGSLSSSLLARNSILARLTFPALPCPLFVCSLARICRKPTRSPSPQLLYRPRASTHPKLSPPLCCYPASRGASLRPRQRHRLQRLRSARSPGYRPGD